HIDIISNLAYPETKWDKLASNIMKNNMEVDIKKLKEGNENEYEKFYNLYINRIYTIIYRVVGNMADAEDIAMNVMMKVYDKIGTFRGDAKLSSWVYRIAYNQAISFLRKQKKTTTLESVSHPYEDKHIHYLEMKEIAEFVRSKLMELPEKYRIALTLYHFKDLSYEEIAYTMGIKMGTVKTYIHRGREELKALVGELPEGV
ncbi:MAG: RNA polymerase sigma factor, partial [Candidatus Stahlbacteria bacterium]